MTRTHAQSGFSLIELLIAMGLLLAVSSIVTSALMQMTKSQTTIWNRTEMHSGIRGATELLQQEVGQAGRVSMPGTTAQPGVMVLSQAVNDVGGAAPAAMTTCDPGTPTTNASSVNVNTTTGVFATVPLALTAEGTLPIDLEHTYTEATRRAYLE